MATDAMAPVGTAATPKIRSELLQQRARAARWFLVPMLIALAILAWVFWPKIQAALNQAKPQAAPQAQPVAVESTPAVDLAAVKKLVAERDRLNAAVGETLGKLKEVLDAERSVRCRVDRHRQLSALAGA